MFNLSDLNYQTVHKVVHTKKMKLFPNFRITFFQKR